MSTVTPLVDVRQLVKVYRPSPLWMRFLLRSAIDQPVQALRGVNVAPVHYRRRAVELWLRVVHHDHELGPFARQGRFELQVGCAVQLRESDSA